MSKPTNDPAAMLAAVGEASTSHPTRSGHSWASQQNDDIGLAIGAKPLAARGGWLKMAHEDDEAVRGATV